MPRNDGFHNIQIILYILPMLNYLFLLLAIVAEAAGTTFLKMSEQFTKLVPSIASARVLRSVALPVESLPAHHPHRHRVRHLVGTRHRPNYNKRHLLFQADAGFGRHHRARPDYFRRRRAESFLENGYPLAINVFLQNKVRNSFLVFFLLDFFLRKRK